MIDTREQVVSSPAATARRSNGRTTTGRSRSITPSRKSRKSIAVERVFSDAKVSPFDQLEWDP